MRHVALTCHIMPSAPELCTVCSKNQGDTASRHSPHVSHPHSQQVSTKKTHRKQRGNSMSQCWNECWPGHATAVPSGQGNHWHHKAMHTSNPMTPFSTASALCAHPTLLPRCQRRDWHGRCRRWQRAEHRVNGRDAEGQPMLLRPAVVPAPYVLLEQAFVRESNLTCGPALPQ